MEFGKVSSEELAVVDFTLPPDPKLTLSTLKDSRRKGELKVHIGCAKWGRKEWLGQIYPEKTKEADFLKEYVKNFDTIELNATFYKINRPETVAGWFNQADGNDNFRFCPKFSRSISHIRRLKNAAEVTTVFYEGILAFKEKLGPLFLQLGDNFTPKSYDILEAYLKSLPHDIPVFVELRHQSWFSDDECREKVFSLMHDLNIGAVITDASGRRDCVHMTLPVPHAFIRFVGNNLDETDYTRIDEWVERISEWEAKGLQSVWFFMHQPDERHSPQLCDYVVKQLNKKLGINVRGPQFI